MRVIVSAQKSTNDRVIATLIRGDNITTALKIAIPRYEGGVDLSGLAWAVNICAADRRTDVFVPVDVEVCDHEVRFEWRPGGIATAAEGLTAKNVCYALHDEADGAEEFCKHVYKNCWVELDNSALGGSGNTLSKALGGGLGKCSEIIIENCAFKATNPANTSSILNVASYHGANNSAFTDAKIIISGCYFEGGNFRASDLSANTESPYPRLIYSGNSSEGAVNVADTWNVKAWNNEVRS